MTEAQADRMLLELERIDATLDRIAHTLERARPQLSADERYELVTPPAVPMAAVGPWTSPGVAPYRAVRYHQPEDAGAMIGCYLRDCDENARWLLTDSRGYHSYLCDAHVPTEAERVY
jgi:hypothetical protein